ncbi:MAG: hypothetical protein KKI08_21120 [Armatimonadetes bacterium]|nr:hypothetical protein [Armatimonadota bacterium]
MDLQHVSVIFLACVITMAVTATVVKLAFSLGGYVSMKTYKQWKSEIDASMSVVKSELQRATPRLAAVEGGLNSLRGSKQEITDRLIEATAQAQAVETELAETQVRLAEISEMGRAMAALSERLMGLQGPLTTLLATRGGTEDGPGVKVATRELNRQFAEIREWHQTQKAGGAEGETEAQQLTRLLKIMGDFADTALR